MRNTTESNARRPNEAPDGPLLPEGLADALPVREAPQAKRYACRPFVARSAEHRTVFGVFSGQIALGEDSEFKAALENLNADTTAKVILDLSRAFLSKSALGVLVSFAALMHGLNRRLYLFAPSPQIMAMLQEIKLVPFFSYLHTEDDIIATLVV